MVPVEFAVFGSLASEDLAVEFEEDLEPAVFLLLRDGRVGGLLELLLELGEDEFGFHCLTQAVFVLLRCKILQAAL